MRLKKIGTEIIKFYQTGHNTNLPKCNILWDIKLKIVPIHKIQQDIQLKLQII